MKETYRIGYRSGSADVLRLAQQLLLVGERGMLAGWQQGWAKECKVAVNAERM
jgi:hypothetical protein